MLEIYSDRISMGNIEKLEYRREYFDITVMKPGARVITTITNDGSIVAKKYKPGSRKALSVQKSNCSVEEFEQLCAAIELCIEDADRQDFYVDDSSEELKIFHKYGRIQTMERGLGNETTHIGSIVNDFLSKHL